MEDIVPDEKNQAEYHSLLGRFYYNEKDFARAENSSGNGWKVSAGKRWRRKKRQAGASGPVWPLPTACWRLPGRCRENYEGALEAAKEALPGRMSPISGSWRRMRF